MKRKLFAFLLTGCLSVVSMHTLAAEVDISNMTLEELQLAYLELQASYDELEIKYNDLLSSGASAADSGSTLSADDFGLDCEDGAIKFLRHEVSKDYEGKPAVVLYFEYTNKSDASTSASFTFYPQVFQNGVECESAILMDNTTIDNSYTDVQPGTTIEVGFAYVLSDMSDIIVELKELISFEDPIKMTLKLQ